MKNTIFVCESGWIIVGKVKESGVTYVWLQDSYIVRCWNNGKGIGGLAKAENKNEYTLDEIGDVEINSDKILFKIPCEW